MSNDLGGRRPRPAANTVSSPPMGSGVAILVTAVALILGFLILHKVNDDGSAGSLTPAGDGGGSQTTESTTAGTGSLSTTTTTITGDFTSTKVQVANCSIQNGVARMMTTALSDAGFTTVDATNGTCDPKLTTSYVIYNAGTPGSIDVANTVAKILGGLKVEPGTVPLLGLFAYDSRPNLSNERRVRGIATAGETVRFTRPFKARPLVLCDGGLVVQTEDSGPDFITFSGEGTGAFEAVGE